MHTNKTWCCCRLARSWGTALWSCRGSEACLVLLRRWCCRLGRMFLAPLRSASKVAFFTQRHPHETSPIRDISCSLSLSLSLSLFLLIYIHIYIYTYIYYIYFTYIKCHKANLSWTRGLEAEGDCLLASFCFNCPQLGLVYLGVTRFSAILAPLGFTWSHSFVYLIPLEFTRSLLVSFASPLLHFVSCGFHLVAKGNFHLPRGRLVCYSLTLFDSVSLRDKKKKWERCSICLESPPDIIVWNLASWIQDQDPKKRLQAYTRNAP